DWSSDVCSSDLFAVDGNQAHAHVGAADVGGDERRGAGEGWYGHAGFPCGGRATARTPIGRPQSWSIVTTMSTVARDRPGAFIQGRPRNSDCPAELLRIQLKARHSWHPKIGRASCRESV